ncbi:unnamed protein product [Paramecium sonneborni]|uniref:Uncharacterized protein n=1 Tax=Paramecium sonneborni TaxID=65129 RepID=A0A8S1RQT0_9CILI|nr:unnamed protein product [Paramecium sonneborni]
MKINLQKYKQYIALNLAEVDHMIKEARLDFGWVELSEEFNDDSQVTYNGDYKNGKKVGMWDIVARVRKIGGVLYTEGDSTKIGSWIELSEGFKCISQVTYKGEYKSG